MSTGLHICSGKSGPVWHRHYSRDRVSADQVSVPAGRLSVPANDNDDAMDSVNTLWKLFDWYHLRQ